MSEKIRILFLSANPWTTSRILVDEEAREIFERIQEGPHRDRFELHKHAATRPIDLQRLLLMHQPHIVHFSGHGNKKQKIILGGSPGRGKTIDRQGLVEVLALYNHHLRLVMLNACFTKTQAQSIAEVIDYSVGTGKGIGDKAGVAFAGAFYRALSFGKSIREAFDSAKAELVLTKMPRTQGIELFVRDGIDEKDSFPGQTHNPGISKLSSIGLLARESNLLWKTTKERFESEIRRIQSSVTYRSSKQVSSEAVLYRAGKVSRKFQEFLKGHTGKED
ncbi:MAG TPA: CHAT domain-containing protein [Pyrinomonadaceae bacterium]